MSFMMSSVRFRLIVLILLAVIPAIALILHSSGRHRALVAEQVQFNALHVARVIAGEQERFLAGAHQLLITLGRLPPVRDGDKASCTKILAGLLEPLYADLALVDANGKVLCSALPDGSSQARPTRSHLKRIVESHDFSIGEVRIMPSGKSVVNVGYPVLEANGLLRRIIIATLDLTWVTRLSAQNHLQPGATFSLVDSNGLLLVRHPRAEKWLGKPLSTTKSLMDSLAGNGERTLEAAGVDGNLRLFAFSPAPNRIGDQTIYAVIEFPAETAFAEANRILRYNLISLAILSALILMAAWFGADLFVLRRIRDLVDATKRIAAGNLAARTRLSYGSSELGQLARSFDDLAETLERREAEAKESARHVLEQRQRQNALYEINLAMTSSIDLESVLRALLEKMAAVFPYCAATVSWVNKQTGALKLLAHRNLGEAECQGSDIEAESGLPDIVLKSQVPLVISNAQIDPRPTNPEFFRRHHLLSYLGLPMIAKGETLGVLSFYTKEAHSFSTEEMDFLLTLANQAAISLYNSGLYEQTKTQAVELQKSNRIKDEFLGVMSHELRTPLNIIMNYAEALRVGMFGELSRDQKPGMDKIKLQAVQLLSLINGILEITKIETGTVALQNEKIDLVSFMAELRSDYMTPTDKSLTLRWEVPACLAAIVSDRMKLKQVLTNLINNAMKFTDQGAITVSVRELDAERIVEFSVQDTGPGISKELLPTVFDKFRQIDSTTTRNYGGAGLGLYIVKTFTELLQGTIEVESEVGTGSIFTVRLPSENSDGPQHQDHRLVTVPRESLISTGD